MLAPRGMSRARRAVELAVACLLVSQAVPAVGQEPLVQAGTLPEAVIPPDGYSFVFTEGPAVDVEGNIYFTDQPNNVILFWDAMDGSVSIFMEEAGRSNGMMFDSDGVLLSAADEKNQLWAITEDKNVTVLVEGFEGKLLNGPNDVWVDASNGVYFTDPLYERDWWENKSPDARQPEARVYYLMPDRTTVKPVQGDFLKPNGVIGSPDGSKLYVSDAEAGKTFSFTIEADGSLSNRVEFAPLKSDGMTVDAMGNVYLTAGGIVVFSPDGTQLPLVDGFEFGSPTTNVAFGGPDFKTLFITARDFVWTLDMNVAGGCAQCGAAAGAPPPS